MDTAERPHEQPRAAILATLALYLECVPGSLLQTAHVPGMLAGVIK